MRVESMNAGPRGSSGDEQRCGSLEGVAKMVDGTFGHRAGGVNRWSGWPPSVVFQTGDRFGVEVPIFPAGSQRLDASRVKKLLTT